MKLTSLGALAALCALLACGSDPETSSTTTGSTTTTTTTHVWPTAVGGAGGGGGTGGEPTCVDTGPVTSTFVPKAADIQFAALSPLPHGEQILFNDWAASPNTVTSMTPDGATVTPVFEAYGIWSMGVAPSGSAIAFACGDPDQATHYGISLGNAIEHTWLYDTAAQTAKLMADGNVNDECHTFGPGENVLYVCRRHDFTNCNDNKTYRLGRIDLVTGAFTFLVPEDDPNMTLNPLPTPDGQSLYYERIAVDAQGFRHALWQLPLPSGAPAEVRLDISSPALSPDGARYVYADDMDGGRLWVAKLDGSEQKRIAPIRGSNAAWSPDGTKVAYLASDTGTACSHIDVVLADGSTADAPTRVRDCTTSGEFITQLAWITRP